MRKEILEYYKNWKGETGTLMGFTDMLMKKATFALQGNMVMAGGKMRNGKEMDEMNSIADDMVYEGLLK